MHRVVKDKNNVCLSGNLGQSLVTKYFKLSADKSHLSYILQYDQEDPKEQQLYYCLDGSNTKCPISNKTIMYRSGEEDGVRKIQVNIVPKEACSDSYAVSYKTVCEVQAPDVKNVTADKINKVVNIESADESMQLTTDERPSDRMSSSYRIASSDNGASIHQPHPGTANTHRHDWSGWKK